MTQNVVLHNVQHHDERRWIYVAVMLHQNDHVQRRGQDKHMLRCTYVARYVAARRMLHGGAPTK